MKKLFLFAAVGFLFAAGAANAEETKSGVGVNSAPGCEELVKARLQKGAAGADASATEEEAEAGKAKDGK